MSISLFIEASLWASPGIVLVTFHGIVFVKEWKEDKIVYPIKLNSMHCARPFIDTYINVGTYVNCKSPYPKQ